MKTNRSAERLHALNALRSAIVEGATWRYERLVDLAVAAGATDTDIDDVVHEALHALFSRAEQSLMPRQLSHTWPVGHFRHEPAQN